MNKRVTVWYDGSCPLCRREIALMARLDRRNAVEFLDVSRAILDCPIDRSRLVSRFHAREGDNILSGAAAFAAMWRAITPLRPIGLAAQNRVILRLLEWLYTGFLRHRSKMQRLVAGQK